MNIGGAMNWLFIPTGVTVWAGYDDHMWHGRASVGENIVQWVKFGEQRSEDESPEDTKMADAESHGFLDATESAAFSS